jgi:hypothetical protein
MNFCKERNFLPNHFNDIRKNAPVGNVGGAS